MNHILVEDNRDMPMPSDMSLFLYIWISGGYRAGRCALYESTTDKLVIRHLVTDKTVTTKKT